MSDFYTKKQRKYWCDKCHIFIEYTKIAIDKHNNSNLHKYNANSNKRYNNFKNYQKKYLNDLSMATNKTEYMLGHKKEREEAEQSSDIFKEIQAERIKNTFKKKEEEPKKWGVYYDETYNLPFYYNFTTGDSVWEKPKDFDGDEKEINLIMEKVKQKEAEKSSEGNIGKWEDVKGGCSFLPKRAKEVEEDEEEEDEKEKEDNKEDKNKTNIESKKDENKKDNKDSSKDKKEEDNKEEDNKNEKAKKPLDLSKNKIKISFDFK